MDAVMAAVAVYIQRSQPSNYWDFRMLELEEAEIFECTSLILWRRKGRPRGK